MAGELNLALVTSPPDDSQITVVPFALTALYAALPQTHAAAQKEHISLQDLAKDEWILFARRVHPVVHGLFRILVARDGVEPPSPAFSALRYAVVSTALPVTEQRGSSSVVPPQIR
jgi:hypothetical protein